MDVYIDKANLLSLLRSRHNPDNAEVYAACMRMLRTNMVLKCCFKREELEEENKDNEELRLFIETYTQDVGCHGDIEFVEIERPFKQSNEWDMYKLSSIFLLEDEVEVSKLSCYGTLLCGSIGEELKTLKKLLYDGDMQLTSIRSPQNFKCWEDMKPYFLPCTDIILCDRYALNDHFIKKEENKESGTTTIKKKALNNAYPLFKKNVIGLLKTIAADTFMQKVRIVILCRTTAQLDDFNYDKYMQVLKIDVMKSCDTEPYITIVHANDNIFTEHDRTVFMNYGYIVSGDSFSSYYGGKGINKTNGRYITFCSMARYNNYESGQKFIEAMNDIISKEGDGCTIVGDRKSGYLKFRNN